LNCGATWRPVCSASAAGLPTSCCAAREVPAEVAQPLLRPRAALPQGVSGEGANSLCDLVACGSRTGGVAVALVPANARCVESTVLGVWSAPSAAPVLAVYLPDRLPTAHVLCSCADGVLRWLYVAALEDRSSEEAFVVLGHLCCSTKCRMSSVEVLPSQGLVVIGESLGGVSVFRVAPALAMAASLESVRAAMAQGHSDGHEVYAVQFPLLLRFPKCHATYPVTLAKAAGDVVFTGGRDGTSTSLCAVWLACGDCLNIVLLRQLALADVCRSRKQMGCWASRQPL
jgi:hypothetical protein